MLAASVSLVAGALVDVTGAKAAPLGRFQRRVLGSRRLRVASAAAGTDVSVSPRPLRERGGGCEVSRRRRVPHANGGHASGWDEAEVEAALTPSHSPSTTFPERRAGVGDAAASPRGREGEGGRGRSGGDSYGNFDGADMSRSRSRNAGRGGGSDGESRGGNRAGRGGRGRGRDRGRLSSSAGRAGIANGGAARGGGGGKVFSEAARRVNIDISAVRTLAELRCVVEANGAASNFSGVNVATAYSRLGRHVADHERGTLDTAAWYLAVERRAAEILPELSAWALSSLTWALGRTSRDPGAEFWAALEDAILSLVGQLEPQGVSNILWAYASLERPLPPPLRTALETQAVQHCRVSGGNKGAGGGGRGGAPGARGVDGVRGGARARGGGGRGGAQVPGFKPYELTMMFWALTRFGDEPCPELRGLFEAQCGRQLHLLKPQELSNVASAYGRGSWKS